MPSQPIPFRLTLPNDLKLLPLARTFVGTVGQYFTGDYDYIEALQLAIHEALQNVMRHGGCGESLLEIQILTKPDGLELCLLDEGDPFDVAAVPHLEPGELRIGGRGVFMMRRLVDELTSEPRQPRGNVLRMVKHFRPASRRHPA